MGILSQLEVEMDTYKEQIAALRADLDRSTRLIEKHGKRIKGLREALEPFAEAFIEIEKATEEHGSYYPESMLLTLGGWSIPIVFADLRKAAEALKGKGRE